MKTSKIGISILTVFVLVIVGADTFEMRVYQNNEHRICCTNNWSNNIKQRKADLASTWFSSDAQYLLALNTQVNPYNKECTF